MKQIELNERGEDVTDYNRGYREGYDVARKQLRDDIAIRAMQGMIAEYNLERKIPESNLIERDILVQRAYEVADAMLKARGETETEKEQS